jgi:hypothetical protein
MARIEDLDFITSSPGYGAVVFWMLFVLFIPLPVNLLVFSVIVMLGFFYKIEYVGIMIFTSIGIISYKYFRDGN